MADEKKKRKPPKGGRKGGKMFPQLGLKAALDYSWKLVAKTHVSSQPEQTLLPGVFGSSGPVAKVKASALKQFGLMEGSSKAYSASKLGKDIAAAPESEKGPYLQKAFLRPRVFLLLFDTFKNDTVTTAKIRQQALQLGVHPDTADSCVKFFIESAETAGLATIDGDQICLSGADSASAAAVDDVKSNATLSSLEGESKDREDMNSPEESQTREDADSVMRLGHSGAKGNVNVTLEIDSSWDAEKLARHLELLKKYGVI